MHMSMPLFLRAGWSPSPECHGLLCIHVRTYVVTCYIHTYVRSNTCISCFHCPIHGISMGEGNICTSVPHIMWCCLNHLWHHSPLTPLCQQGVAALLSQGADPNGRSSEGFAPLCIAAFWGYAGIVQLLLRNGWVGGPPWQLMYVFTATEVESRSYVDWKVCVCMCGCGRGCMHTGALWHVCMYMT